MRIDARSTAVHVAAALLLSWTWTAAAAAQDLSVAKAPAPAPAELSEAVRGALADDATTVMRGSNMLQFWWLKSVPLDAASAGPAAWAGVPAGSLVGAVRIAQPLNDIRGGPIKPGVYTLRYALQPQDGDHTGVSPYREFLLVAPAAEDTTTDPVGYKGAVALAKKSLGKSHPAALSLDPPAATADPGAIVTNEAGHKAVVFEVPAMRGGAPAGALRFGLILVGLIQHQM